MINTQFKIVTFEMTFKNKSDGGIHPHVIPYPISYRSSMGALYYPSMSWKIFFSVLAGLLQY